MSIFRFSVGSDAKSMAVPCVFAIGVVCWANFDIPIMKVSTEQGNHETNALFPGGLGWDELRVMFDRWDESEETGWDSKTCILSD